MSAATDPESSMKRTLALLLTLPLSCQTPDKSTQDSLGPDTGSGAEDADRDGYPASEDCNDGDAAINPGGLEICDGVDNNCDGEVDEDVGTTWYADADADGYGDGGRTETACTAPENYVANGNDCDDGDETVFPGASEICDGLDNDCDGEVDDDDVVIWYEDADGDGAGNPDVTTESCLPPEGHVLTGDDCDDERAEAAPDLEELCDEIDNDCDGDIDEGVTTTWYQDRDGDGFGEGDTVAEACSRPAGYAAETGDCDDEDPAYNPDADESDCTDPEDYNCDGSVGYADADEDGWAACEDCDDANPAVRPDATEVCNSIDDDCDGFADDEDPTLDDSTTTLWYEDDDGDSYGDPADTWASCAAPTGFVADGSDCNDSLASVHPSATEVCNGIDDDCDSLVDGADPGVDSSTGSLWYVDADGDGYGSSTSTTRACARPSGYVSNSTDCNDANAAISPAATEVCDDLDNDCDGLTDDADSSLSLTTAGTWYRDADSDGYGASASSTRTCDRPSGYVTDSTDCNDGNAAISPGATEICNDIDDDCDLYIDDADDSLSSSSATRWYDDDDADGYGDPSDSTLACDMPPGHSAVGTDCDDTSAAISPADTEICNGVDDDCDGSRDEGMSDADADGICDALDSEECDGADNDGDGSADEGLTCSYSLLRSDSGGLCVDDDLYIYKNGAALFLDGTWGAQCHGVITFTGSPGDSFYMYAVDSVGGCRSVSDVYIRHNSTGDMQLLAYGYSGTCGHGASSSAFWAVTATLPGAF
jgi:hypothetical protein